MLELWGLGLTSAVVLQSIASAACRVAPRAPMQALAEIGANGNILGNCHRDLERKLNMGTLNAQIASPWYIDLPLWDVRLRPPQVVHSKYRVLLPHIFLASLYGKNRSIFDRFVTGGADLEEWWSHIAPGDPRLIGHPRQMAKP